MNKKRERDIISTSSSLKLNTSSFIERVSGFFKRKRYTRNSDASFITVRNDIGNNAYHNHSTEVFDNSVRSGKVFGKNRDTLNEISCNGRLNSKNKTTAYIGHSVSSICVNTQTSGRVQILNANSCDISPSIFTSMLGNNDISNYKKPAIMSSLSKYRRRLVTKDVVNSRYIPQSNFSTSINSNQRKERKIDSKNDQSKKKKEWNGFNRLSEGLGNFDNNDIPDTFPYRKHFTSRNTHLYYGTQISTNFRGKKSLLPGNNHLKEKDINFRFQKNVNNTKGLTRRGDSWMVSRKYRPASRVFTSISRQNSAAYELIPSSLSSNSVLSYMDKENSRKMREKCNMAVAKSIFESSSRTFHNSGKIGNSSKSTFGPPFIKMSLHGLKNTNRSRLVCYEAPAKNESDVVEIKRTSVENVDIDNVSIKDPKKFHISKKINLKSEKRLKIEDSEINTNTCTYSTVVSGTHTTSQTDKLLKPYNIIHLSTDRLPTSSVNMVKSVSNQNESTASSAHVTMSCPIELHKWIGNNHAKCIKSCLHRNENGCVLFPTAFLFGNMIDCNKEIGIGDFGVPSSDVAADELIRKMCMRKDSIKISCPFSTKRQSSLPERIFSSTSALSSNNFTASPYIKMNEYNDDKVKKNPFNFTTLSGTVDFTHPIKAIPIVNKETSLTKRENQQVELDILNNDKKILTSKYGLFYLEKKRARRRCNMCTNNNEKFWFKCDVCRELNLKVQDDDKNINNSIDESKKVVESMKNVLKITATDCTEGFGNIFAPKPGEWRCNVCFIKNPKDISRCLACEKEKPLNNTELSHTVNFPDCIQKSVPSFAFGELSSLGKVSENNSNIVCSKSIFSTSFIDSKKNSKLLDNCNTDNVNSNVSFGGGQSDSKNSLSSISNHSQFTLELGRMVPNKETTAIPGISLNSKSDNFGKIKDAFTYSSIQTNLSTLKKERVVAIKESLLKVKSKNSNLVNRDFSTLNNKPMLDSHAIKDIKSGPTFISFSKSPTPKIPIQTSCIDSSRVNNPFSVSKPFSKHNELSFCGNSGIRIKSAFSFSDGKNTSIRSGKVNKLVHHKKILFGDDTSNVNKHESKSADSRQNRIASENGIIAPNQFIVADTFKRNISNTNIQSSVSVETSLSNDAVNNSTKSSRTNSFGVNFLSSNNSSTKKSNDLVSSSSSIKFLPEATSEIRTFNFGNARTNSVASLSATENTEDVGTSKYLSNLEPVKSSTSVFHFGTQSDAHSNSTGFSNGGFSFNTPVPSVPPTLSVGVESGEYGVKNISSTMHQPPHESLTAIKPTTSSFSFGVSSSTPTPPTNSVSSTLSYGGFGVPTSMSTPIYAPGFGTGTVTGAIPLNGGFSIGIGGGKNSGTIKKSGRRIVRARRPPVPKRL